MKFAHLHVHSDASLKDGLGPIANLVAMAKDRGFEAIALTDHGTLANAVAFTVECNRAGIKPILGVEGYLTLDNGKTTNHITLLADGEQGWRNLVALNNLGHASTFKEPAFTFQQLLDHAGNLVCLSGCVSGPINTLPHEDAVAVAIELRRAFGKRFFIEVMFAGDSPTWERPFEIARLLNLPVVVTNDVHFGSKNDKDVHPVLTRMKAGFDYNSAELYLKTPAELLHQARRLMGSNYEELESEVFKWIQNAARIAAKITPVTLKAEQTIPEFENAEWQLRRIVLSRMETMYGLPSAEYVERVDHELKIIAKMGYCSYFLILDDLIEYAKDHGVRVGPGRGSGAGSLVLYYLGVTQVDPIKHKLSFERFLNVDRHGMPDVDVDFDSERRELVLEYAKKKYGAIPIATYSRFMHKSLTHDLAKQFRIPKASADVAAELGPDSKQFLAICEARPDFEQAYNTIVGQIRHKGKHAGGVVITEAAVPIERVGDTLAVAWTEGNNNELTYAGVVKFDLLGLSALTIIRRLEARHFKGGIHDFVYPDDNPKVFDVFKSGRLDGIFQFSGSAGIRELTVKLQPNSIEDLTAINALYRPGALDAGTCQKYPEYKKSPRKVPPLIADILEETYGVVVYQEQLMAIVQRALEGTFAEADLARSTITKGGKKTGDPVIAAKIADLRDRVIAGFTKQGMSPREAKSWWSELETHGRYSFNKSHSVSYATVAYWMAWWKANYPASFYAECLNIDPEHAQDYIMAAVAEGIRISRPGVNSAGSEWLGSEDQTAIIVPLSALKYLSVDVAKIIETNRPEGGYKSITHFMELNPKSRVRAQAREAMWFLGSFRHLPGSIDDLGLKPEAKAFAFTPGEAMRRYLGFVIPTVDQYNVMKEFEDKGYTCGIVINRRVKKSAYGPYVVYYLSPSGVFWTRDAVTYGTGQLVAAKIGKKGKLLDIVRIVA